jgi:two-component system phosphate regulon sensor histidine kinase PhoR
VISDPLAQEYFMSVETSQHSDHGFANTDEAELRSQVLSNLLKVSTYLVSVLDPAELLPGLAQHVVDVVPAIQASLLWLYDRQQSALRLVALHGLGNAEQRQALFRIAPRPGEGLAGAVLQRGESLLIEGRATYREMTGKVNLRNQAGVQVLFDALPREMTAVFLPLRIGNETIGVLELLNLGHPPPLRRPDLQVLQTFANLTAGAIKNAQFHVQMQADQRRLEAFSAISTAISAAADLNELMGNVLDVLMGVVHAAAGTLFRYQPARQMLVAGAHRNLPAWYVERYSEMLVAEAPCAEAVRYGQPILRPLTVADNEGPLLEADMGSCIYLPLLAGGTVAGVVCMYSRSAIDEPVDVRALMMMGSLIGFAIANVTLYEDSDIERRRLKAVIDSIAEGVVLCDGQGRLVMANETARSLLSIERVPYHQPLSEMPDFYAIRDMDGEPLPVEQLPLALALSGQVFHDYRVLLRGASGEDTVMSFSGAPVYRDDHTADGAVVVFRDITASQKMERAKDDFLAVAAHELRSPLAAVRSYTDLLVRREMRRGEESTPELRGLTILGDQVSHMLRLVDNLLDVSRLDADQLNLQLQPVNLVALVEQVIEQQRPAAGDRTLRMKAAEREIMVVCDQMRIRQVLTNLISNAVRYSSAGTPIIVDLSLSPASVVSGSHPDFVDVWTASKNGKGPSEPLALIAVEDQGVGISEEQMDCLFNRYSRGRERRGDGLGLGLYLSREFVVRHGGAIWVESSIGVGSTFYVALPIGQPSE